MTCLSLLASELGLNLLGVGDPEITGITEDSRLVQPGNMFVAAKGAQTDGRDYILDALGRGATCLLLSEPDMNVDIPRLLVGEKEMRPYMARAAAFICGRPAEKMSMIGLTGTNGKTTSAYLLESVLSAADQIPGVMGTVNYRWPGAVLPAPNTTPEGPVIHANLAAMVEAGVKAAIMEVSSHALVLGRTAEIKFDAALFTNFSRDHLDFHACLEDYFQVKRRLFVEHLKEGPGRAAVNIDDPYGRRLADELGFRAVGFGFGPKAAVRGRDLKLGREGLTFTIESPAGTWEQRSPLLARINAYNLLGVVALALSLGLKTEAIAEALSAATGAPGRLERVGGNNDYLVLVDYSHTPDSLAKALEAGRDLKPKRLLTVFGCGGNRDRGKRPLMGRIAGEMADLAILTSDNPRTENPESILKDVEQGLLELGLKQMKPGELADHSLGGRGYLMVPERRQAIGLAVSWLKPGDVLIIAGKGHEDYQIIGVEKKHFDDREEALRALAEAGLD